MIKHGEMWPAAFRRTTQRSELWERPGLNKAFFVELRRKKRRFHHPFWRFPKSYGCYFLWYRTYFYGAFLSHGTPVIQENIPSGPPISCDLMEKYVTKIGALGNILA